MPYRPYIPISFGAPFDRTLQNAVLSLLSGTPEVYRFALPATEGALQNTGLLHNGTIDCDKDRICVSIGVEMSGLLELSSSRFKRLSPAVISRDRRRLARRTTG